MKKILTALAFLGLCFAGSNVSGETLVLQATSDFPTINAGAVPYYKDGGGGRNVLAINAAIEENRDKFARATTEFTGSGGTYDVTLATLGEIDGECDFRLLINGTLVGSATNARVAEDWGVQEHVFADVPIPAGATIAVESNAVTNGLIPEGDITAYARGRWRSLTLVSDSTNVDNSTDLALTVSVSNENPQVGDTVTIDLTVENKSATTTATNPAITASLPDFLTLASSNACSADATQFTCPLSELTANGKAQLTLVANTVATGSGDLALQVSADQSDSKPADNAYAVTVTSQALAAAATDLAISLESDTENAAIGSTIRLTASVSNNHAVGVATAPNVGIILPPYLQFTSSDSCSATGQVVNCQLAELTPGQSRSTVTTVTAVRNGSTPVIASVSSAESESETANNEAQTLVTAGISETTPEKSKTSGGGAGPLITLLMLWALQLLVSGDIRRRKRSPDNSVHGPTRRC